MKQDKQNHNSEEANRFIDPLEIRRVKRLALMSPHLNASAASPLAVATTINGDVASRWLQVSWKERVSRGRESQVILLRFVT